MYPYSGFMKDAGYENMEQEIQFNPTLADLAMRVLKFEIQDHYRPLQVTVAFESVLSAEDLKEDEGVPVTISFNIDSDASERELEKLLSIKDDDYTEVVEAINEKAVARMKQMKEKYQKTKEKEIERQKQQQIKEMKKNNKIKVRFRR
jgi:DNA-directed RNA polymerase specialized sigma subunit